MIKIAQIIAQGTKDTKDTQDTQESFYKILMPTLVSRKTIVLEEIFEESYCFSNMIVTSPRGTPSLDIYALFNIRSSDNSHI